MHIRYWWESQKESATRRKRVYHVKMDLREVGWGGMDCIDLAEDRDQWRALVNTAMILRAL
jgi:hypothetical protein